MSTERIAVGVMMLAPHRFEYQALPLHDELVAYRDKGQPVGGFLTALLSNDLVGACGKADETNLWLMPIYAAFLYNEMPSPAHGSREKVQAWVASFRPQATPV